MITAAVSQATPDPPPSDDPALSALRRDRLLRLIDQPFLASITLITAPAGFGKSTLATQWATTHPDPVAWLSLDQADNSPDAFLAHLAAALNLGHPDQNGHAPLDLTTDAILNTLQTHVVGRRSLTLLLDDYHLIENRDVHQAMDGLIAHLPSGVHLILLSRTLPHLALARRRAQGQVRELTEGDLRFTLDETHTLITTRTRGRLSSNQITRLTQRTDGWIAGLRLALLALDHVTLSQIDHVIETLAEQRWLDDYIVEEVLGSLPAELRTFVLRTSALGTLTPAACDFVLERENSTILIDEVARHLVLVRRDGAGVTYHALFAECLARIAARHLSAAELRAQHRRAAQWFEQHGQPETAIEHALSADDLDTAVRLTKLILPGLMDIDWSHSAIYWLSRLPLPIVVGDPDLAYAYVWSQLLIGRAREAWQIFDHVERDWLEADDPVLRGRAMTCRIYSHLLLGRATPEVQELRQRALALLPDEHAVERLHLWSGIAADAYVGGDDEVADDAFRQAESCAIRLPPEQNVWFVLNTVHRPNQAALRGRLPVAIALYQRALDRLPARLRYWEGGLRYRLAAIHLERNELPLAREQAAHYEPEIPAQRWEAWHPEAWIVSAQIRRAAGEVEEASALLDGAISALEEAGVVFVVPRARALQAAWWLADGRLDLARAWDQTTPFAQLDWGRTYGLMHGQLTRIQLRAAEGHDAAALALTQELITEGEQRKRWAELIPFYAWEATLQFQLGHPDAALAALRTALHLGMPGGLRRSFTPLGADVQPLFTWAIPHLPPDEAAYLQTLRDVTPPPTAFSDALPPLTPHASRLAPLVIAPGLDHPLSARELEVLHALRDGVSNREIAQHLYITERTVKKHVGNLLAKLAVPNRAAAVRRAQSLGLLD